MGSAVDGLRQGVIRDPQPLHERQLAVFRADGFLIKFARSDDAVPVPAHGGEELTPYPAVFFREPGVGAFQLKRAPAVYDIFSRQKKAETRLKVVIREISSSYP